MADSAAPSVGRVFISYRREETSYAAAWLFDRLADRFGRDQIFKDIDSIQLGDDFVEVITNAVGSCDVLLALIGDRWLTITDEQGRARLDDPDDFVRLEIEAALNRDVRVIPILVAGARMPHPDQLPPSLAKLVRHQALELSPARFEFDTNRLLRVLLRVEPRRGEHAAGGQTPFVGRERLRGSFRALLERARRGQGRARLFAAVAVGIIALATVGVVFTFWVGATGQGSPNPTSSPSNKGTTLTMTQYLSRLGQICSQARQTAGQIAKAEPNKTALDLEIGLEQNALDAMRPLVPPKKLASVIANLIAIWERRINLLSSISANKHLQSAREIASELNEASGLSADLDKSFRSLRLPECAFSSH